MLRNFFEGLGDLFQATFKILPIAGDSVNRLFMACNRRWISVLGTSDEKAQSQRRSLISNQLLQKAPAHAGAFLFGLPQRALRVLESIYIKDRNRYQYGNSCRQNSPLSAQHSSLQGPRPYRYQSW